MRDLLLGRESQDIDLVVEGDGIGFAHLLAEALGGRVRAHPAFLTAVVFDPAGPPIDVSTARTETYRAPAALPEVRSATLREDLVRRDFTVNTLALRLGEDSELIDDFGGRRDLEAKTLRVLHDRSFVDDPTRILRGVRLEARLGFHLAPETRRLVAAELFDPLSGSRLREELEMLLDDATLALPGIERLAELGLLRVLHPRITLDDAARARLQGAQAAWDWYHLQRIADPPPVRLWRLHLMALAGGLEEKELESLAGRLMLAGEDRRLLTRFFPYVVEASARLDEDDLPPHKAVEILEPLSGEELLLLMTEQGAWVRRYLTDLRPLELGIRGGDLLAAGAPPGPGIGEALRATRRARLDGRIGPEEELDYALGALR